MSMRRENPSWLRSYNIRDLVSVILLSLLAQTTQFSVPVPHKLTSLSMKNPTHQPSFLPPNMLTLHSLPDASNIPEPSTTFQPQLPEGTLISLILTTLLSLGAYIYWSETIVPAKRVELIKDKQAGGSVSEYLDRLEVDDDEDGEEVGGGDGGDGGGGGIGKGFQRWLFTDWLRSRKGVRVKKERAIPGLKGKFNSGDNPVLVGVAGIIALGVADGVLGRIRDVIP